MFEYLFLQGQNLIVGGKTTSKTKEIKLNLYYFFSLVWEALCSALGCHVGMVSNTKKYC